MKDQETNTEQPSKTRKAIAIGTAAVTLAAGAGIGAALISHEQSTSGQDTTEQTERTTTTEVKQMTAEQATKLLGDTMQSSADSIIGLFEKHGDTVSVWQNPEDGGGTTFTVQEKVGLNALQGEFGYRTANVTKDANGKVIKVDAYTIVMQNNTDGHEAGYSPYKVTMTNDGTNYDLQIALEETNPQGAFAQARFNSAEPPADAQNSKDLRSATTQIDVIVNSMGNNEPVGAVNGIG